MAEKIFAEGMFFDRPKEGAPEFIKGKISIKAEQFTAFIQKHAKNGYVNLDLKESKGGKLYLELNTWSKDSKPLTEEEKAKIEAARAGEAVKSDVSAGSIPF